jgi:hypothetical protein
MTPPQLLKALRQQAIYQALLRGADYQWGKYDFDSGNMTSFMKKHGYRIGYGKGTYGAIPRASVARARALRKSNRRRRRR